MKLFISFVAVLLLVGLIACTPAPDVVDDANAEDIDSELEEIENLEDDLTLEELDEIDKAIAELE